MNQITKLDSNETITEIAIYNGVVYMGSMGLIWGGIGN